MTITLSPDQERAIHEAIRAGQITSVEELILRRQHFLCDGELLLQQTKSIFLGRCAPALRLHLSAGSAAAWMGHVLLATHHFAAMSRKERVAWRHVVGYFHASR